MLAYSFDRFYVVIKFMLPMLGDIKFTKLNCESHLCIYEERICPNTDSRNYLTELRTYCNTINLLYLITVN